MKKRAAPPAKGVVRASSSRNGAAVMLQWCDYIFLDCMNESKRDSAKRNQRIWSRWNAR